MNRMFHSVKSGVIACLLLVVGCSGDGVKTSETAQQCFENTGHQFNEVLACYRAEQARRALDYVAGEITEFSGVQKRSYVLTSQDWSPNGLVQPAMWQHEVTIYVPIDALSGRALLVANNGINNAAANAGAKPASDFSEAMALSIARKTRTIVVSVSNIPNQYLTYLDDGAARREDSSVAHSWQLFSQSPPFMSVHVPMMESLVKSMDLAVRELRPWHIRTFIATGASKRAWAVWLTALADPRIDAIAPFVADILAMDKVLDHTAQSYGGNWPVAFGDYVREGITEQRKTEQFAQLEQIEDPLLYLRSAYAERLAIPKYLINASGDDFFVPDNTRYYLDQLPGVTALRVVPNSDHGGIKNYLETSLVTLVNRLQHAAALPVMTLRHTGAGVMQVGFSETPVTVRQWVASDPVSRDFRYACGIRYEATALEPSQKVTVALAAPEQGWSSSFVEAQFADGFVMTTPVSILPDTYPHAAPPEYGPACKTIPAQAQN